jgi:hypothetical protein
MKKFKQSLCSVSIALALSASASAFTEDERTNDFQVTSSINNVFSQNEAATYEGNLNVARIGQGMIWGVSEGNDSSISISGMGSFYTWPLGTANAEILVDGTDNVSSIEQINTESRWGIYDSCCSNYAWAYTTTDTDSAAANNTGNVNTIYQYGGDNRANSEIQVGSYNSVNVFQEGFNPGYDMFGRHYNANASYMLVNGDYNSIELTSIGATDKAANLVQFNITGDNNSALININSDSAYFGPGNKPSHLTGNNNTLTADINDTGFNDVWVEFTGDDNTISILTEGNSPGKNANSHQVKLKNMKGDGNSYDIKSYGSAASHNLENLDGDDNQITITNLQGYNNRTIVNNLTGNRNTIDITIDGEGGDNQANVGKNPGDDNVTTVSMNGYKNNVSRLMAEGNNNITTANVTGNQNIAKFSAAHHPQWSPGFSPTSGEDNEMIINQDGERNYAAYMDAGDGRYYHTTQIGNDNSSLVRGTGNEKYVTVWQNGELNNVAITYNREAAKNGNIAGKNSIQAFQKGDMNNMELDVTASSTITVDQIGNYNDIKLMVIHADDAYAAEATTHHFFQKGDGNMIESEVATEKWSKQYYNQIGNDNYIYFNDAGGFQNFSNIDQEGDMNTAYVTIASLNGWSESNKVDIDQIGDYNEVDLDINGNRNGKSKWDGKTARIAVEQVGDDNLVVGTDGFGFTIAGEENSVFLKQVGNGNTISGAIVGDYNTAQIHQIGNYNFASININGY